MKPMKRMGVVAVLGIFGLVAPALAGDVTVGRFYTEIAQAKHLTYADPASAEASLRGAGFDLPSLALDKSLTEGDVASISNAIGLTVTTQRPSRVVTDSQMNMFLTSFGGQIGVSGNGPYETYSQGGDPGQSGNGKGKKKGHNKSTSDPY